MALEIDAKNAAAAATGDGGAPGKAKAKENKSNSNSNNNNVPAAGEKNLVNGSSAATKKKGALTMIFSIKATDPPTL